MSFGYSARLDGQSARVVGVMEERAILLDRKVFVGGFPGSGPVAVIVNQEHSAHDQPRIKNFEFLLGGLVPIGIEAQDADGIREAFLDFQRLADLTLDELGIVAKQPVRFEVALNIL